MELGEELIKDARGVHRKHSRLDNVVLCCRKRLKKKKKLTLLSAVRVSRRMEKCKLRPLTNSIKLKANSKILYRYIVVPILHIAVHIAVLPLFIVCFSGQKVSCSLSDMCYGYALQRK